MSCLPHELSCRRSQRPSERPTWKKTELCLKQSRDRCQLQAGITNAAFRRLCYDAGAPLCVSEMVTAGTLLQRHRYALKICEFDEQEPYRSAQLYGVRPEQVGEAAGWLVRFAGANHVDLNFGCPVKKVPAASLGTRCIPVPNLCHS